MSEQYGFSVYWKSGEIVTNMDDCLEFIEEWAENILAHHEGEIARIEIVKGDLDNLSVIRTL